MDIRLYAEDIDGAMRSANRAGGNAPVIAKARFAVIKKAADAKAQLDGVPAEARRDIGYIFSRAQWLRREDKATEAAELMLSVPNDPTQALDADQWWIERRFVSRTLLDLGDAKTAYRVASAAAVPNRENYRAEHQFTSGWIALRFLDDAGTALAHFAKVGQGTSNPIALARASYWQGRAAETLGKPNDARAHYESAARYSTAYYGQLARARLGLKDIVVRPPPDPAQAQMDVVRAIEILYAIGERDLIAERPRRPRRTVHGRWRRSRRSAKSPPGTKTRAPWCCLVRRRSGADSARALRLPYRRDPGLSRDRA